jgi:hypothetical protein
MLDLTTARGMWINFAAFEHTPTFVSTLAACAACSPLAVRAAQSSPSPPYAARRRGGPGGGWEAHVLAPGPRRPLGRPISHNLAFSI